MWISMRIEVYYHVYGSEALWNLSESWHWLEKVRSASFFFHSFSAASVCLSLVLSAVTHTQKSSSSFLSVSLSQNCSFNQRIGPKSGWNIMTGPIAMEIMSACWRHGLFWRTLRTQQSQYSLACQSQCPPQRHMSGFLHLRATNVVCKYTN